MTSALQVPAGRARRAVRPPLEVIPGRRRMARFVVGVTVLVGILMIGAVVVHTRLAERQLDIDQLERDVRTEQQTFDALRAQRAQLRSPTRLATEATAMGMTTGTESTFISVDPMVLAITIARTGEVPVTDDPLSSSTARMRPLDQFRLVKSLDAEAP